MAPHAFGCAGSSYPGPLVTEHRGAAQEAKARKGNDLMKRIEQEIQEMLHGNMFNADVMKKAALMVINEIFKRGTMLPHDRDVLKGIVDSLFQAHALNVKTTEALKTAAIALQPFADFADPNNVVPASMVITNGSRFSYRQLQMSDCYRARDVINMIKAGP